MRTCISPYKMCLNCPFSFFFDGQSHIDYALEFCSTIFAIGGMWMWLDLGVYLQHPFWFLFLPFFYVNILHLVIPESCTCFWFQLCLSESSWGVIIYFRWEMLKVNLIEFVDLAPFPVVFFSYENSVQKKGTKKKKIKRHKTARWFCRFSLTGAQIDTFDSPGCRR